MLHYISAYFVWYVWVCLLCERPLVENTWRKTLSPYPKDILLTYFFIDMSSSWYNIPCLWSYTIVGRALGRLIFHFSFFLSRLMRFILCINKSVISTSEYTVNYVFIGRVPMLSTDGILIQRKYAHNEKLYGNSFQFFPVKSHFYFMFPNPGSLRLATWLLLGWF